MSNCWFTGLQQYFGCTNTPHALTLYCLVEYLFSFDYSFSQFVDTFGCNPAELSSKGRYKRSHTVGWLVRMRTWPGNCLHDFWWIAVLWYSWSILIVDFPDILFVGQQAIDVKQMRQAYLLFGFGLNAVVLTNICIFIYFFPSVQLWTGQSLQSRTSDKMVNRNV